MTMKSAPPKSVDEYLAPLPEATRSTLEQMRKVTLAAYPEAVEGISYGLPYYRYRGRMLIAMGAAKNHCSLHGVVFEAVGDELKKYETTKGALHIPIGKPPTAAFIKKLLKARIEQDDRNVKKKTETAAKAAANKSGGAKTVDAFIAALPDDARATLNKVRQAIRSIVPDAVEAINYGVPSCKYEGRNLVSIGAAKGHCAFYVQSPAVMEAHKEDLAGYDTAKGTVRFPFGASLPVPLVRKLIKARIEENRSLAKAPKTPAKK